MLNIFKKDECLLNTQNNKERIIKELENYKHESEIVINKTIIVPQLIKNFLPNSFCDFIINCAEEKASDNLKKKMFKNTLGWTSQRHNNFSTRDLAVKDIPAIDSLISNYLIQELFPKYEEKYLIDKHLLYLSDLFVVKYKDDDQNCLEKHKDGSPLSFSILLNNKSDFVGGGTIFYSKNKITERSELYEHDKGDALIHSGKILHEGRKITKGCRYLLVGFININNANNNKFDLIKKLQMPFLIEKTNHLNLNSFSISSDYEKKLFSYLGWFSDAQNRVSILDLQKEEYGIDEKLVYELYKFHMKRLNLENELSNFYVEFWINVTFLDKKNGFIKQIHIDKDEVLFHKKGELVTPILSTITYLDDTNTPTVFSNTLGDADNIHVLKRNINLYKGLTLSFPRKLKHVCFNGSIYHGVLNLHKSIMDKRKTLCFNIFSKQTGTPLRSNVYKEVYDKNTDYFNIKMDNNKIEKVIPCIDMYSTLNNIISNRIDHEVLDKLTNLIDDCKIDCKKDIIEYNILSDSSV